MDRLRLLLVGAVVVAGCSIDREGTGPVRPPVPRDSGTWVADGRDAGDVEVTGDAAVPPSDATCERLFLDARPNTVRVMIVLDRSASMYDDYEAGPMSVVNRWTPSVTAIQSVAASLEDRIEFGLTLFGTGDECATGMVRAPPALHAAEALRGHLAGDPASMTGGGTPTAATLDVARGALEGMPGENVVLLVTDGAPNCNESLDAQTCRCTALDPYECADYDEPFNCLDDAAAIAAVRALREASIRTFVIGYDTTGYADVMDRMAAEGGTGFERHFPVTDGATLETALRDIGGSVVPCRYELDRAPGNIRFVRVTVDGTTLDHTSIRPDAAGWTLEGSRTVVLLGASCAAVQDGTPHTIEVVVECEPVIF